VALTAARPSTGNTTYRAFHRTENLAELRTPLLAERNADRTEIDGHYFAAHFLKRQCMTPSARTDIEHPPTASFEREPIEFGKRAVEGEILLGLDLERNTIGSKGTNAARSTRSMMIA